MPAPKITIDYIQRVIQRGDGQGHGRDYKPWIQIRRWNPSPISTQVAGRLPPFFQRTAFLSANEWHVARIMAWVGAEVRAQYPAWPWRHPEPLYGLNTELDLELQWSRGMKNICQDAGINHGNYPGTHLPYVWTLDFMLTLRCLNHKPKEAVVSIKWINDEKFKNNLDPIDRQVEKLEAERRFANELGIPYYVTGAEMFPDHLKDNLAWLVSAAEVPKKQNIRYILLQNFLDVFVDLADSYPIEEWVLWMQKDQKASWLDAQYIVQHILWHQYVDVDLTLPVRFKEPVISGGRNYKSSLRKKIFK